MASTASRHTPPVRRTRGCSSPGRCAACLPVAPWLQCKGHRLRNRQLPRPDHAGPDWPASLCNAWPGPLSASSFLMQCGPSLGLLPLQTLAKTYAYGTYHWGDFFEVAYQVGVERGGQGQGAGAKRAGATWVGSREQEGERQGRGCLSWQVARQGGRVRAGCSEHAAGSAVQRLVRRRPPGAAWSWPPSHTALPQRMLCLVSLSLQVLVDTQRNDTTHDDTLVPLVQQRTQGMWNADVSASPHSQPRGSPAHACCLSLALCCNWLGLLLCPSWPAGQPRAVNWAWPVKRGLPATTVSAWLAILCTAPWRSLG